jgi:GNAT superfamily N-acetyltransferase
LRAVSFSEWYGGREASWSLTDNRYTSNAAAALFPDFYLELRDADEKPVGYLHTAPGFWSGDIESLPNFDHVVKTLNLRQRERLAAGLKYTLWHEWLGRPERFEQFARPLRARRQSQANAVLLLAMMVDPERRRHKLPTLLLNAAKDSARRLGYPYVNSAVSMEGASRRMAAASDLSSPPEDPCAKCSTTPPKPATAFPLST